MLAVSAILIAAGESTRMGRPKPLLTWHGLPLVQYQTASLIEAGVSEVVVVLGHEHDTVVPHVKGPGVRYVLNPLYPEGKTTSIKAGLRALGPTTEAILLLAVDQPRPSGIVATIIDAHRRAKALITSPIHLGCGGHPLMFSPELKAELERITEERQGVREVFLAHKREVSEVEIDDPIVRLDLNSPEEYDEAREKYGA